MIIHSHQSRPKLQQQLQLQKQKLLLQLLQLQLQPTHLHTYTPTHLHTYTPTHLHTYTPHTRSLESAFQSQELMLSPSRARPGKLAKVDNGEEDKMSDAGSVTGLPTVEAMREALGSNQNQSKGRASTGGAAGSGAKPQQ